MNETETDKGLAVMEVPELREVEESKATQIIKTFGPMAAMVAQFEKSYRAIVTEAEQGITQDVSGKARALRLQIRKIRTETDKSRKAQKRQHIIAGLAIDAVSHVLTDAVSEKEERLKEIENYFVELERQKQEEIERAEAERLNAIQIKRRAGLAPYVDPDYRRDDLCTMDDEAWSALLAAKKRAFDDGIAVDRKARLDKIRSERAANQQAVRLQAENVRLQEQSAERDRLAAIEEQKRADIETARVVEETAEREEREKVEAARVAAEEADRKKRDEADAKRKAREEAELKKVEDKARKEREALEAELQRVREEREQAEREERAKREKVEAELEARKDADLKKAIAQADRLESELNKGDAHKIEDLVSGLKSLKGKFEFKSKRNKEMYSEAAAMIDGVISHILGD